MHNKDSILLEQAYNQVLISQTEKIILEDLKSGFSSAAQSYSNQGDNSLLQLANMFSQAFSMIGSVFGASSKGGSEQAAMTIQQAKSAREKIAQVIQSKKSITFNQGGVPTDAKPYINSMLSKLDASIKQAEDTAQVYSQAGFFGKLFKDKGDSVMWGKTTPDEYRSMEALERSLR